MKVKVWDKPDGIFQCRMKYGHESTDKKHVATGLYEYQTIEWTDGDRRQFTGEWVPCQDPGCILPAEHQGEHPR